MTNQPALTRNLISTHKVRVSINKGISQKCLQKYLFNNSKHGVFVCKRRWNVTAVCVWDSFSAYDHTHLCSLKNVCKNTTFFTHLSMCKRYTFTNTFVKGVFFRGNVCFSQTPAKRPGGRRTRQIFCWRWPNVPTFARRSEGWPRRNVCEDRRITSTPPCLRKHMAFPHKRLTRTNVSQTFGGSNKQYVCSFGPLTISNIRGSLGVCLPT